VLEVSTLVPRVLSGPKRSSAAPVVNSLTFEARVRDELAR